MLTATIEEVQANLTTFIAQLKPDEQLVITKDNRPIARLQAEPTETHKPRTPGTAIGKLTIIADDDTHLEEFKEYMP